MCTAVAKGCINAYNSLDQAFTEFTNDKLPKTVARIAQELFKTLPLTCLVALAPMPCITGFLIVHILAMDFVFSRQTYVKIALCIVNIPIIQAISDSTLYMATKNSSYASSCIANLCLATLGRLVVSYWEFDQEVHDNV